jgi:hypothetical protein
LNSFAGNPKSLREGGAPHGGGNYAIESLIAIAGPFTVRVIVKGDDKIGGSLVDTEGVELKNVQIAPLKN